MIYDPITDAVFAAWKAYRGWEKKHPTLYGILWVALFTGSFAAFYYSLNKGMPEFIAGLNVGAALGWAICQHLYNRGVWIKAEPLFGTIFVLAILVLFGVQVWFTLAFFLILLVLSVALKWVIKRTPLE